MKPFELALWLATALLFLRQSTGGLRNGSGSLSLAIVAVAIGLIGMHLFFEGWRKPLLPAAAALILLSLLPFLLPLARLPIDGLMARLGLASAGLMLAASTGLNWLHPAVTYPALGGPYAVIGMTILPVSGQSAPGDVPTLDELRHPPPLVKLWYPAQPMPKAGLFDPGRIAERSTRFLERGGAFDEPALVDAPPLALSELAPLLLYFSGWPGTSVESTSLVRELVSHGYYVATIEYPARQPGMSEGRFQALKKELERSWYYGTDERYRELVEVSIARVRSRSHDASAVLDRLLALASTSGNPFNGHYNPKRVGIIGFSFGGGVATQTLNQDPRFLAAINLDGRHWAEGREEGAKKPLLMISEPLIVPDKAMLTSTDNDVRYNAIEDQNDYAMLDTNLARHGGMHVTINGALHFNFSDLCLTSPLQRLSGGGTIAPLRGYAITYAYVLAWFDRALKRMPSSILDTESSPFPEVDVRYWSTPDAVSTPQAMH